MLIGMLILLLAQDPRAQRPGDVRNPFFPAGSCSAISFAGSRVRISPPVMLGPKGDVQGQDRKTVLLLPGS